VARASASLDLLASADDVWAFLAEPYHLPDWWPGLAGVEPDRRGVAPGARWRVRRTERPTLLGRAGAGGLLIVREVEPPSRLSWHLTGDRLDVELVLESLAPDRTRARLAIAGPLLVGARRSLPRRALRRLQELCQTAAEL